MSLTVSDFFCGAGGSSTGISQIPGLTVKLALNHWQRAIETHSYNHPDTDHACADIAHIRPEYTPRTNILWASPECTNHSNARGKKRAVNQDALFLDGLPEEAAERSRATMWDVPRFAEVHQYDAIMTENVVEAGKWGPFQSWLGAMESLGYDHHQVYMNAMHAQVFGPGAPQSRDRMYVVFWRKGNPRPDFDRLRPYAECDKHGRVQCIQGWKGQQWGKYRQQYHWRCPQSSCRNQILEPAVRSASDAIDWALQGKRIGDRVKPLAAKSLARIVDGMVKFPAADNLLVTYYGTYAGKVHDVELAHTPTAPASFDPSKCGTMSGYKQHRKFGIAPCQPCKDAAAAYHRDYLVRARNGETVAKFLPDRCGSMTGYRRHMRHGVPVCVACRAVRNEWKRGYYAQQKVA
jgi:DNA (cytosine-5)-methyltransferase 1